VSAYLALAESIDNPRVRGGAFNFSPESRIDVFGIVKEISRAMESDLEPIVLNIATREIKDQTLHAGKAREILNWQPSWSLEAGLRQTIPWYRNVLSIGEPDANAVR
jgi:CDP-glucose 4,6-dehydratase